jgi:triosephosphate isomerase
LRKALFIANWKMNKKIAEARKFCEEFLPLLDNVTDVETVICPPFTCLHVLSAALQGSPVKLGAQDLFWEDKGAYTGEISASMLLDAACEFVIVGHSERRQIVGENDTVINRKLKAALDASLLPVLCIGETLQERENSMAMEVVKEQLHRDLRDIELSEGQLLIAYEPVWAIGTGVNASSDDVRKMIAFVRECLAKMFSQSLADSVRILYGGSVNEENIKMFLSKEEIDGALVGGASLQAESFAKIVRYKEI